jgi:hypothetical protein
MTPLPAAQPVATSTKATEWSAGVIGAAWTVASTVLTIVGASPAELLGIGVLDGISVGGSVSGDGDAVPSGEEADGDNAGVGDGVVPQPAARINDRTIRTEDPGPRTRRVGLLIDVPTAV